MNDFLELDTQRRLQSFAYQDVLDELYKVVEELQPKFGNDKPLFALLGYIEEAVQALKKVAESETTVPDLEKLQRLRELIECNEHLLSINSEEVITAIDGLSRLLYQGYAIFAAVELVQGGGNY